MIISLVKAGAKFDDRDADGKTPLINAIENDKQEAIAALTKAGAKPDDCDKGGMTTLMNAARYTMNSEIITMLLKAGASGKVKDSKGLTAFDCAKENRKLKGTATYWALNNARF